MSAEEQSPAAEAPPSKIKALLPFAAALLVGLGAGAGSGLFVVGPALAKGIVPTGAPVAAAAEGGHGEEAAKEEGGEHGEGKGEAGAKQVYTLDNLLLNPAESGGTRFLLLSVAFETADAALVEDMKNRDAELRDAVLVTVGAKSVEYLSDMSVRDSLKSELRAVAGKLFPKKQAVIRRIYFPQFVIQ